MRINYTEPPSILIVDDEELVLKMLEQTLSTRYEVSCATSGTEALAMVADAAPELVLLDIDLPDIDGYEICRRLKQNPATRDIPVIFQTRYEDRDNVLKGYEAGASDYAFKGASVMVLMARIDIHLQLYRQKKALDLAEAHNRELLGRIEALTQAASR